MNNRLQRLAKPYLMILPALFLAYLFCYRPFFRTVANSLFAISRTGKKVGFVGLENYAKLFGSESFQASLSNTLRFTLYFVPSNILVTLSAALLCNRKGRLASLQSILFFIPMAIALSSAMMLFKMLFNPSIGVINSLLKLDIQWFNDPKAAMALLVMAGIWLDIGFDFLLFAAALRSVPQPLSEAMLLDGASKRTIFFHLQIPFLAPTLIFVLCNNIKDAMLICSPVIILTEGGPFRSTQTLVYQMFLEGFKSGNYSLGSALATVIFTLTFAILLILLQFERRRVYYQ
ncbi:sugar ABC transporter permease [uncultured Sphaerochaeta sp.]|uniref:carbohydrate ABC transporter permease n=1 Tax=uncultured Sphaerochaeta sp. TaxID=886478 RepID=UPI002A0A3CBC|nr:sugar ABC transporter permease [uncultured Sphaerochaeta sp.]